MFASLKLEAISDATRQRTRLAAGILRQAGASSFANLYKSARPYPWVARITGLNPKFGFDREFIQGRKDYTHASSNGNRGVYLHYLLEEGIYEVQEVLSWSRVERYFVRSAMGRLERMERQEVESCLSVD